MLSDFVMGKTTDKAERKQALAACRERLAAQQQEIKAKKLGVLVLLEGWGAAGKGSLLGEVINEIDPRSFKVYAIAAPTEEERRKPFLWRYFVKTPERGLFSFLDSGWLGETVRLSLIHICRSCSATAI